MTQPSERLHTHLHELAVFVKWLLYACAIGILVGLVAVAFHLGIDLAKELRTLYPWLIWFLPLGGAAIVLLYRVCGLEKDRGTNLVLIAVREAERMKLRTAPLIFLSTILTHLVGGSAGREGAALQLGAALSANIGQKLRLDQKDSGVVVMCGMAAAFSGLFGTPLTAAIFAMEVVTVGRMYYAALVPCLTSSFTALLTAQAFGLHGSKTVYPPPQTVPLSPLTLLQAAALGVLCAVLSVWFCKAMHAAPKLYARFFPSPLLRAMAGGALVLALTLLVGSSTYNGAGDPVIRRLLEGETIPEAFLLKILFTALTLGAGFRGGRDRPRPLHRLRLRGVGWPPAGTAPQLFRRSGHDRHLLRHHQLPPDLPAAGLRALRRGEPDPLRPVLRSVLHAVGLLRPVQRAEDHLLQIPDQVDRPQGRLRH